MNTSKSRLIIRALRIVENKKLRQDIRDHIKKRIVKLLTTSEREMKVAICKIVGKYLGGVLMGMRSCALAFSASGTNHSPPERFQCELQMEDNLKDQFIKFLEREQYYAESRDHFIPQPPTPPSTQAISAKEPPLDTSRLSLLQYIELFHCRKTPSPRHPMNQTKRMGDGPLETCASSLNLPRLNDLPPLVVAQLLPHM